MTESLPSKAVDTAIMEISNLSNVKELVDVRIDDVYQARIDEMDVNDSTSVLARTKNAIKHLTRIRENLLLTEQELEEERDGEEEEEEEEEEKEQEEAMPGPMLNHLCLTIVAGRLVRDPGGSAK